MSKKKALRRVGAGVATAGLVGGAFAIAGAASSPSVAATTGTASKIQHVVVIYDENISFDHYFGTYPYAANTDGQPFKKLPQTPVPDNFAKTPSLLRTVADGGTNKNTVAPFRLGASQTWSCSQNHNYQAEQQGVDADATGKPLMDKFVESTSAASNCATSTGALAPAGNREFASVASAMGYYDGNTVTGLWNYAQNYAMSDNSWADNFGPSTVGALNVVSGQTGGAVLYNSPTYASGTAFDAGIASGTKTDEGLFTTSDGSLPTTATSATGAYTGTIGTTVDGYKWVDSNDHSKGVVATVTGDPTPAYDECTDGNIAVGMQGKNVGDLLNEHNVSWGSFLGGFDLGGTAGTATPNCNYSSLASTKNADGEAWHVGGTKADYLPHHNPFQYYKSTSNPTHAAPASGAEIGHGGKANHMYDLSWFKKSLDGTDGATLPTVSYVRPIAAEDGHGGYSDPTDEQAFIVRTINQIEQSKYWPNTAIVIAYDDSDGYYDHVAPTILNGSSDTTDQANGTSVNQNVCTKAPTAAAPAGGLQYRCGPSQRLPFLVISPYAKQDYIDHTRTSQASIVKFIEDTYAGGARVDNSAVSGAFDATAGSMAGFFNLSSAPHTTPLILDSNGSIKSGGLRATPTPSTGNSAALTAAKAKLAKDKAALAKAKKALRHAKGHKKAVLKKKVARLNKAVKADQKKVASLS